MMTKAPAVQPKSVLASIPYSRQELNAMYALSTGQATSDQQVLAWDWIIGALCRYHDVSYRPGTDGERDTSFAEGRRFVAVEMIKMTKINPARLETEDA